jgi:hypothetical protein
VRQCDDAVTNAASAVGTLFRDLVIKNGCDKCSQSFGDAALLSTDASEREHYNAIFDRVDFVGCAQPLRMTDGGRFLVRDSLMLARRGTGFPCLGPFFSSSGDRGVTVHVHGSIVAGCRRGIRVGGGAQMTLAATLIERSAVAGLRAVGDARVSIAGSRILANGGRTSVERGSGGLVVVDEAAVDVGGGEVEIDGLPPSAGGNLLCGNIDRSQTLLAVDASQVRDPERAASARNNWWCDADPPAAISGNVDFTPSFDFPR